MPVSVIEQRTVKTPRTRFAIRQYAKIYRRKWDISPGPYPHDALTSKPGNFEQVYGVSVTRMQLPNLPLEWDHREKWQPLLIKRNGNEKSKRLLNYWHGGAFINKITSFHWKFLGRLTQVLEADVVLQTYTMVPYAGIQENLPKLITLYQCIHTIAEDNKQELIIGGDSAGGQITASVLLALHDRQIALPDQAFMVSPALTLDFDKPENRAIEPNDVMLSIERTTPILRAWATGPIDATKIYEPAKPATKEEKAQMEHPYAAPLNGDWSFVKAAKMPITLIQGTYDLLLPQNREFVQVARNLDLELTYIEADRAPHVFPLMAEGWFSKLLAPDSIVGFEHLVASILKYSKEK